MAYLKHLRPWILLGLVTIPWIAWGISQHHRDAVIVTLTMTVGFAVLVLNYGRWRLMPRLDAKLVLGQDPWGLGTELDSLCQRHRISRPTLHLLETQKAQALVLGNRASHSAIIITRGLIELLSPAERSATLAYLVACIQTRATLSFTVGSAIADLILGFAQVIDRALFFAFGRFRGEPGAERIHLGTLLLAPLAGIILRIAVGRRDYLEADHLASTWIQAPRPLASALWKLNAQAHTVPFIVNPATSAFFIVNPLTQRRWTRYFRTHPKTEERIRSLVGSYPL